MISFKNFHFLIIACAFMVYQGEAKSETDPARCPTLSEIPAEVGDFTLRPKAFIRGDIAANGIRCTYDSLTLFDVLGSNKCSFKVDGKSRTICKKSDPTECPIVCNKK